MKRIAVILALGLVLATGVTACAPPSPTPAEQKAACFTNEKLAGAEMKLFYEDAGIYPPIATVVEKLHVKCPSGGTYSFDEATGIVSCSVHRHP